MQRHQFEAIFHEALAEAARNAETKIARSVPHNFEIELHGAGYRRALLDPPAAIEQLYLDPDRFYRVIDIAVTAIGPHRARVFVRVSNHEPGSWDQTWNDPPGSGPFRQLLAESIEVTQD